MSAWTVSHIVNGCVGAQGTAYGSDYINDLLMSQPLGMAGAGRTGMRGRKGPHRQGFGRGATAYGVAEPSAGCAS
jgi:hypothetical protein